MHKNEIHSKKLIIIGAGFSGLTLAYYAIKNGFAVEIFEKSEKSGGLIQTKTTKFGIAETAANAILNNSLFEEISKTINVNLCHTHSIAKNKFIYRHGLSRWPFTILETCRLPFRMGFGWIQGKLSFKPSPLESIHSWCTRIFGEVFLHYLVAPALQGIYAGNPNTLSASLIFRSMQKSRREKEKLSFYGSISAVDGLGTWLEKLEEYLKSIGVLIHYQQEYEQQECSHLAIATSASAALRLIQKNKMLDNDEYFNLMKNIKIMPALSATVYFQYNTPAIQGFGCLFPRQMGFSALGVVSSSEIFPNRAKDGIRSETWIFSGEDASGWLNKSDPEILEAILSDRRKIFPETSNPMHIEITRWPEAIPNYDLHLEKFLDSPIETELKGKKIWLHGNYLGSLGLAGILRRSKAIAAEMASTA